VHCPGVGAGIRTGGRSAGNLAAAAPVLLALVPKCPLCALPLLAAAGVAMPSGPVLDGMVAAAALLWLTMALARWRSPVFRSGALAVVLLLVGGRLAGSAWASVAACAVMIGLVLWRLRVRVASSDAVLIDRAAR
jgi:hypothetical protein